VLVIRRGPWKLSVCAGDGVDRPWCTEEGVPHDISDADALAQGRPPMQLYNVQQDPGETRNLVAGHPDVVADLLARLRSYVDRGRSTPGPPLKNDQEIRLRTEA
jgi:arylsulfatase A